jgi:hypothetical protein
MKVEVAEGSFDLTRQTVFVEGPGAEAEANRLRVNYRKLDPYERPDSNR